MRVGLPSLYWLNKPPKTFNTKYRQIDKMKTLKSTTVENHVSDFNIIHLVNVLRVTFPPLSK